MGVLAGRAAGAGDKVAGAEPTGPEFPTVPEFPSVVVERLAVEGATLEEGANVADGGRVATELEGVGDKPGCVANCELYGVNVELSDAPFGLAAVGEPPSSRATPPIGPAAIASL